MCGRCVVVLAEEEDLARELLPDLSRQVRGAVAGVEAADVGVGLLEACMLGRRQRQVADDVQAVPASDGPPGDDGDHDLGHDANQPLHLEDVQPAGAGRIDGVARLAGGVLVPGSPADPLVPARAECPAAIARRRSVTGEQYAADIGCHSRVVERAVQLVDGVRAERVAHLGPIKGNAHGSGLAPDIDVAVIRHIGEVEAVDRSPFAPGSKSCETDSPTRRGYGGAAVR